MTYIRDPYDAKEPPCFCGLTGPARTTEEFCPAHGDPDKPVTEPEGNEDEAAYADRLDPCACPCHDDTHSPICMTCCDDR